MPHQHHQWRVLFGSGSVLHLIYYADICAVAIPMSQALLGDDMGLGNTGGWSSRPSGLGTAPVVSATPVEYPPLDSAAEIAGLLLHDDDVQGSAHGRGGGHAAGPARAAHPNSLLAVAATSHAARPMTQEQHRHRHRQLQHQEPVTIAGRAMRGNRKKSGDFAKVMQYEGLDTRNFTMKASSPRSALDGGSGGGVGVGGGLSSTLKRKKSPAGIAGRPPHHTVYLHHQQRRGDKPFAQHHYQQQQQQYQMQHQRQQQPQQSKASKAVMLSEIEVDRSPMLVAAAAKASSDAREAAEEALETAIVARTAAAERQKQPVPEVAKVAAAAPTPAKSGGRVRKLSTKMAASVSYVRQYR